MTGNDLRTWRQKTFKSQEKAAEWYGVSYRTWQRWERGPDTVPQHVANRINNLDPVLGRPK